jgi:hypothetical protein
MRPNGQNFSYVALAALAFITCSKSNADSPPAEVAKLDTAKIEQLTGAKGTLNEPEGVFKVNVPRADLMIKVGAVKMTPPMGLTSWAAFKASADRVMVMGDMVMTEPQVNTVMSAALDAGLDVTALHNHFFGDNPKVMFMHIGGMGDHDKLASAVGKVFARIQETSAMTDLSTAELDPATTSLDPKKIEDIVQYKGTLGSGVYKMTIGRTTSMHGHDVGNTMGVNTWAAFVGSDEKAVVDGDFAMLETELQDVLRALRAASIDIVAIHHHMTFETPRIVFLHYWGIGTTTGLAKGLKAALDKTAHPKS